MMDQVTYLAWAIGQSQYYRPCPNSVYACGSSYATTTGTEPMVEHDLTRARQLVKESGYDGQPIVVLHATDRPIMNAAAIVTRQRLESIGFKVILKAMDWSANLVARARKEPPSKGGWNLLHTWWQAADVIDPAIHFGCQARARALGSGGQTSRSSRRLSRIGCAQPMKRSVSSSPTRSRRSRSVK
jgi:peptide/nickel transport system substrate-binding protein